jgi:PAS domain-containing protein
VKSLGIIMPDLKNNRLQSLEALFKNMKEGVAFHEIVFDDKGKPVDYRLTDVNSSFEEITNIPKD